VSDEKGLDRNLLLDQELLIMNPINNTKFDKLRSSEEDLSQVHNTGNADLITGIVDDAIVSPVNDTAPVLHRTLSFFVSRPILT
jgi:hypothetical protein